MRKFYLFLSCLLFAANSFSQTFQWARQSGGACSEVGSSVAVNSFGENYTTGWFCGTADFDGSNITAVGGNDVFIAKYDTDGNLIWAAQAGGTSEDKGYAISLDSSGIYITGIFSGIASFGSTVLTSVGNFDVFVAKCSPSGQWLWAIKGGGGGADYGNGITTDASGVYITGYFPGTATFGSHSVSTYGVNDIFIAKCDQNGNWLWAQHAGSKSWDASNSVTIDNIGNIVITGSFDDFYGYPSFFGTNVLYGKGSFIAKYDASGTCLWAVKGGGSGTDVKCDPVGNIYLLGIFSGTADFSGITLTSDGPDDYFFAKYSISGTLEWVQKLGGTGYFKGNSLSVGQSDDIFITGTFDGGSPVQIGGITLQAAPPGNDEIFIAKFDFGGNAQWAKRSEGNYYHVSLGLGDWAGNAFGTGYFLNSATFGSTVLYTNPSSTSDAFVTKINDFLHTDSIAVLSYCPGETLSVPYTLTDISFLSGNVLTAQLSNAAGSFASPVNIGTLNSSDASGTISATIPQNTAAGTAYRIRVIASSPLTIGADNGENITIKAAPLANAGTDKTICPGRSATLTATATGGTTPYSFLWNTGATTTSITVSPLSTSTYTVTITGSNGCGRSDSAVVNVVPTFTASISPGNDTAFCQGGSITLTASGGSSYLWSTGAITQSINATTIGNYIVTVTDINSCQAYDSILITVNSLPTEEAGEDTSIFYGQSVQIGSTPITGNIYSWSPTTGLDDATISNPLANPTETTTYELIVTNVYGCSKSSSITIVVNPALIDYNPKIDTVAKKNSITLDPLFDNVFDNYGNEYPFNNLIFQLSEDPQPLGITPTCIAGIFRLHFDDAGTNVGFDDPVYGSQRQAVACQVFTDLSQLIVEAQSPYSSISNLGSGNSYVEIWVKASLNNSADPTLGTAGQFFLTATPGIAHGTVWQTINSGIDAWFGVNSTNLGNYGTYHGLMQINFGHSFYLGTDPLLISSNEYDLYTVILHESIHALGFGSLINQSGKSSLTGTNPGIYSIYDTYLTDDATGSPLINWTSCYSSGLNNSYLSKLTTLCAINFDGTTPTFVISGAWSDGTSLSHYPIGACGNTGSYVMNPSLIPEVTRRSPDLGEVTTLCDIGYSTSGTFSTTTYPPAGICGSRIAGVNDYATYNSVSPGTLYSTPFNISFSFSSTDFLGNDENAGYYQCLEVVNASGSLSGPLSGGTGNTISFIPNTGFMGSAILRYIPRVNATGPKGNITYIFILVQPPPLPPCAPNQCEMVCYGGLEEFTSPLQYDLYTLGMFTAGTNNGFSFSTNNDNSPDFRMQPQTFPLYNSCGGTFTTITAHTGNNYVGLILRTDATGTVNQPEGPAFPLNAPLDPGETATVTLWARLNSSACNAGIQVRFTNIKPCQNGTILSNCPGLIQSTVLSSSALANNNNWQQLQFVFTNTTTTTFTYLLINSLPFQTYHPNISAIFIDDISCVKNTPILTITKTGPATACPNDEITYNINVCNNSTFPATNVQITDNFSSGLVFSSGGTFTYPTQTIGSLAAGQCQNFTLNAQTTITAGTVSNTANVSSGGCLSNSTLNSITTTIAQPTLNIAQIVSNSNPTPGSTINLTVNICNYTADPVNNITIQTTVPAGNTPVAGTGYTVSGNTITFNPFNLGAGTTTTPSCSSFVLLITIGCPGTGDICTAVLSGGNVCSSLNSCNTIVVESPTVTITSTEISCNGICNGTLTATGSGGTSPYSFSWSGGLGTGASKSNVCAGTYTVTISDNNNCTGTDAIIISEPLPLALSVSSTATSCDAAEDGSATVSASGGTTPYSYLWSSGGSGITETGLFAGTYTVTVTDDNGCTEEADVTIIAGQSTLSVSVSSIATSCDAAEDGSATVSASGGTTPYSYSWSSGGSGITETGLFAGAYSVTVTDDNGCAEDVNVTVVAGQTTLSVSVTSTNATCSGICDGSLNAVASGGTSPYAYLWSGGLGSGKIKLNVCAGTYIVTVTDANGCTATAQSTILNSLTPPHAAFEISTYQICMGQEVDFFNFSTPAGLTYSWDFGDGASSSASNPSHIYTAAGTYTITLTVSNACGQDAISHSIYIITSTTDYNNNCCSETPALFNPGNLNVLNNITISNQAGFNNFLAQFINNNIIIEGTLLFTGNIGTTYTLSGKTIQFGLNGQLVIDRGIIFNAGNCVFTGMDVCNTMWQGISVYGQPTALQTSGQMGKIGLTGCTVRRAHIGIMAGRRNFISQFGGGIVNVNGCTFFQNGIAILFDDYDRNNISSIKNSLFNGTVLPDPGYQSGAYKNPISPFNNSLTTISGLPKYHVYIFRTHKVTIRGNTFQAAETGIEAFEGRLNVGTTAEPNIFANLRFGIKSNSYAGKLFAAAFVVGNQFINPPGSSFSTGIRVYNGGYSRIDDNLFENDNLNTQNSYRNGIYMENSSSFYITDNTLTKIRDAAAVNNSGKLGGILTDYDPENKEIGNLFTRCRNSVRAWQDNRALQINCNSTFNNDPALYSYNFMTFDQMANQGKPPSLQIETYEQAIKRPAGNKFDISQDNSTRTHLFHNCSGIPCSLPSPGWYIYYHHSNSDICGTCVVPSPIGQVIPMNNNISYVSDLNPCDICFECQNLQYLDSTKNEIIALEAQAYWLSATLDNGKTQQLLTAINSNMSNGNLKNLLVANSPLSDAVLFALINKANNSSMPAGIIKEILSPNMPVSGSVYNQLLLLLDKLPQGIQKEIEAMQTANASATTVSALERKIEEINNDRQIAFTGLALRWLEEDKEDSLVYHLQQENTYETNAMLFGHYLSQGDLTAATTVLNSMIPTTQAEQDFVDLQTMLLQLAMDSLTIFDADSSQIAYIRFLAYHLPESQATTAAKAILGLLFGEDFEIVFPEEPTSKMANGNQQSEDEFIHRSSDRSAGGEPYGLIVRHYPEPSGNSVYLECFVPLASVAGASDAKAILRIYSLTGQIQTEIKLNVGSQLLEINTSGWSSGMYFYSVTTGNGDLFIGKMTKANQD